MEAKIKVTEAAIKSLDGLPPAVAMPPCHIIPNTPVKKASVVLVSSENFMCILILGHSLT
jgi:hypothetical protein